jgi:hypothetical protein
LGARKGDEGERVSPADTNEEGGLGVVDADEVQDGEEGYLNQLGFS